MRSTAGILLFSVIMGSGCEIGGMTGGPGVEPPFVGPGDISSIADDESRDDLNPAPPPGGEPDPGAFQGGDDGGAWDIGGPDAGSTDTDEPETCEQSARGFLEEFGKIADEHSGCDSAEDCTVVRAKMSCTNKKLELKTCARSVSTGELTDIQDLITQLAAFHYCTDATEECIGEPACVWPLKEATCVDNRCTAVYP